MRSVNDTPLALLTQSAIDSRTFNLFLPPSGHGLVLLVCEISFQHHHKKTRTAVFFRGFTLRVPFVIHLEPFGQGSVVQGFYPSTLRLETCNDGLPPWD